MGEPTRILVVDDDSDVHELCRLSCTHLGHTVLTAFSAAEGKALMETEPVDLVILDVMMEEADSGFEMARWLSREYPAVPVLLLSSIADASIQTFDTRTLHVAEIMNKPVSTPQLRDAVARLVGRCS